MKSFKLGIFITSYLSIELFIASRRRDHELLIRTFIVQLLVIDYGMEFLTNDLSVSFTDI